MPLLSRSAVAAAAALALCAGCTSVINVPPSKGRSILSPAEAGRDTASLEVTFARIPAADEDSLAEIWKQIDETQLPAAVRRELSQQGFRVGQLGELSPPALDKLIGAAARPKTAAEAADQIEANQPVRKQSLQLLAGRRQEIMASGVYSQWPVLMRDDGQVRGRTLSDAQGFLVVKAYPQGDGRVKLELKPEIQYGQMRTQVIGDDGMFRIESSKPKQVLDKLALEATLPPGGMLLLAEMPDRPGSLGHYFFTEPMDGRVQKKLLVIRFTKTECDDLFNDVPR